MKCEEIELLLTDLCARIPYKVKYMDVLNPDEQPSILQSIDESGLVMDRDGFSFDIVNIKPYLFPLSSMTLEQRCKVQNLLPDKCKVSFTNSEISFYGEDYHKIKLEQFEKLFNLFNMWYIDYRGLIPMGLAIDVTDLNIY